MGRNEGHELGAPDLKIACFFSTTNQTQTNLYVIYSCIHLANVTETMPKRKEYAQALTNDSKKLTMKCPLVLQVMLMRFPWMEIYFENQNNNSNAKEISSVFFFEGCSRPSVLPSPHLLVARIYTCTSELKINLLGRASSKCLHLLFNEFCPSPGIISRWHVFNFCFVADGF